MKSALTAINAELDAIRADSRASFCVIDQDEIVPEKYTSRYRSAVVFGQIRMIEEEREKREAIEKLAVPYVDEISRDVMGNLICRRKGSGPRVMFSAHMDSIGFIVTHIEEGGFLRVGKLGGIAPKEAAYAPVRFKSGVRGVFAPEEKADFGKLKLDECFIDIGARDRDEAKKLVQVGDTCVYDGPVRVRGGRVTAPYLDDRMACAVLLSALERMEKPPDVIIRIPVMVMVAKTEMVAPPMTAWGMVVSTAANLGTSPAASSTRAAKANTALLMTRLTVTIPTFWL